MPPAGRDQWPLHPSGACGSLLWAALARWEERQQQERYEAMTPAEKEAFPKEQQLRLERRNAKNKLEKLPCEQRKDSPQQAAYIAGNLFHGQPVFAYIPQGIELPQAITALGSILPHQDQIWHHEFPLVVLNITAQTLPKNNTLGVVML